MNCEFLKIFLKKNFDYIISFFVPLFAFLSSVILTTPIYNMNDDFIMRAFIEGRYLGYHSEFVIFINCFYLKILKHLYLFNENIPWYDLAFAFFIFISFFIISFCLNKILKKNFLKYINSFILFIFAFVFFTTFQFTLVSSILSIGALCLACLFLLTPDKNTKKTIFGFCYICFSLIFSSLIRIEAFSLYLCVGLIFSLFFIKYIKFSFKKIFLLFLIILCFFTSQKLKEYNINQHNMFAPNFMEYNGILAGFNNTSSYMVGDENFSEISNKIKNYLKKSNYSENDFDLLTNWYSTGDSIYSGENIKILNENINKKIFTEKNTSYFLKKTQSLFNEYFFDNYFIFSQILLMLILITCFYKKQYIFKIISIHFLMVLLISVFGYFTKPFPFRVYYPLLVFEYIIMVYLTIFYEQDFPKYKNFKFLNILNILLILSCLIRFSYDGFLKKIDKNNNLSDYYKIIKDYDFSNYKYIFVEPLMGWCLLAPYDMNYTDLSNKIMYNWNVYSPQYNEKMKHLGMERNLYKNFLKKDVFFLSVNEVSKIKELQNSIKEHQNIDTEIQKAGIVYADKIFVLKFKEKN